MKLIVSVSAFALVSSFASANTTPATPEATPVASPAATPAATPAAVTAKSSDTATKVEMRVHLDPFYKNLNDAAKNYKIPKLDSLRLKFDRNFGKSAKAFIEFRLHELEKLKNDGKGTVNTDVVKYFNFLFNVPEVDGLEAGYVRELESGLIGYTDRIKATNVTESTAFTGHLGRVEGYRLSYKMNDSGKGKMTYHLARNQDQNETTLGTKPKESTWYHKFTANEEVAGVALEFGYGMQGKWLALTDSAKLKYDLFYHLLAEYKVAEDLKIKAGLSQDSYATAKTVDSKKSAGENSALTALVAAKYDLLPKELTLLAEVGVRSLKLANKDFNDYTTVVKTAVDNATETSMVLAGQYFVDEKVSLTPSYTYYSSNRAQIIDTNNTGKSMKDRGMLVSGAERKATKSEQSLGLRLRYDY